MTSILTNTAATSSLQALTATQNQLSKTQAQISSGLAIGTASDNEAYWSIGQTMSAQVTGLSAVQESLNLTKGLMQTTASALDTIIKSMTAIKADIVTARGAGVDLNAIQADIEAQKQVIDAVTKSASFSGQNLLTSSLTASYGVVNVSNRTDGNLASSSSTTVYTASNSFGQTSSWSTTNFYDADGSWTGSSSYKSPIDPAMSLIIPISLGGSGTVDEQFNLAPWDGNAGLTTDVKLLPPYSEDISNDFKSDTGETSTTDTGQVYATPSIPITFPFALPSGLDYGVLLHSFDGAVSENGNGGFSTPSLDASAGDDQAYFDEYVDPAPSADGQVVALTPVLSSIDQIYVTGLTEHFVYQDASTQPQPYTLTSSDFDSLENLIDANISAAESKSAQVGGTLSLINNMQAFNASLSNALTSGIGSLVDADMNVASTRLQALQTQQQLGIQALSMANQNSSLVLKLFQAA